ncbi:hypothetical protein CC78DRAFT_581310 [Lojkania enalia]|uniref:Uncharacterized protein n=1 Tax=Lojkania enalia TaxID=147567 RepID=A0A9P4MZE1_9PLEO|nr:hypothetical protein CC78DRAFT_581310 [Didymosphaeria enalia]
MPQHDHVGLPQSAFYSTHTSRAPSLARSNRARQRRVPYGPTPPSGSTPSKFPRDQVDVPTDLLPFQALLWAKDSSELRRLTRLSAHVTVGGILSRSVEGLRF